MRRRFGTRERVALLMASGGRCQICGTELDRTWEADHVRPYSAGGPTDVLNGQALCQQCNREKGDSLMRPWPAAKQLRKWQERFIRIYRGHDKEDFLLVATPGGGKTTAALRVAHMRLSSQEARRVVVVCPTEHLKKQWAKNASEIGIQLDPDFNGHLTADFNGAATTYAQVASNPYVFRELCRQPLLAIFGEVHHAGEQMPWGDALGTAFATASNRLLLSGTPFRTGPEPIPFVRYEDGVSRFDFAYGYGDALRDGNVVRRILFPSFETKAKWYRNGEAKVSSFTDAANDRDADECLRTVLRPDSEWMSKTIKDAHHRLMSIRDEDHRTAAGLIVTMSKWHAQEVAKRLKQLTGVDAVIVTSDEPDASKAIEAFAESTEPWIIAVKMISEGVDIPRLRVGVYATNVLTEMYFRQVVGRFIRWMRGLDHQDAYLWIAAHPKLVGYAEEIKVEREHVLDDEIEESIRQAHNLSAHEDKIMSPFVPIAADGIPHDTIVDRDRVNHSERQEAAALCHQYGFPKGFDPTLLALVLRSDRKHAQPQHEDSAVAVAEPPAVPDPIDVVPSHQVRKALRANVAKLVSRLSQIENTHYGAIYNQLTQKDGVTQDKAGIPQLENRIRLLQARIKRLTDG